MPNVVRRVVTTYGPDPLTRVTVGALDRHLGQRMAGIAGPPARIGLDGDANTRRSYRGELGALQRFRGGMTMGVQTSIRKGFGQALPATTGLTAQPDPTVRAAAAMSRRRR